MNIEITYSLEEKDFLTYQLYVASNSTKTKARRKRSILIVPIIMVLFGSYFFLSDFYLGILYFIIGAIWFAVYPIWQSYYYKRHYKSHVRENYQNRINKTVTLKLTRETLLAKSEGIESSISTKLITGIVELPEIFILKMNTGEGMIIPKDKVADVKHLTTELKDACATLNVPYDRNIEWIWK